MRRIEAPTLVIAGGEESHLDQGEVLLVARCIPNCDVATVPGGHDVHRRRPEEFSAVSTAFLSGELGERR